MSPLLKPEGRVSTLATQRKRRKSDVVCISARPQPPFLVANDVFILNRGELHRAQGDAHCRTGQRTGKKVGRRMRLLVGPCKIKEKEKKLALS